MDHGSPAPPLPSPPNSQPASQPASKSCHLACHSLSRFAYRQVAVAITPEGNGPNGSTQKTCHASVRCWGGLMHCLPYHPVCRPRLRAKSLDSLNKRFWLGICYRDLGVLGVGGVEARQLPNRVINSRQMHAGTVVPSPWRVASCEPFLRSSTKHCLCCGHIASPDDPHKGATDRLHCPGNRFRILISEAWNLS
jgi:hypothetical protein